MLLVVDKLHLPSWEQSDSHSTAQLNELHFTYKTLRPILRLELQNITLPLLLFFVSFQPWQSEEEGSWLREYPVTLMQFFRYLYHNVPDLSPMWHSPEFLCALAAAVFPFNIRPYSEMVRLNLFSENMSKANLSYITSEEMIEKF